MALFVMILRKMVKNKWLELSLLLGLILSVALISSMPIYTSAILQRMLVKDLQNQQVSTEEYPGIYWTSVDLLNTEPDDSQKFVHQTNEFMKKQKDDGFGLPALQFVHEIASRRFVFVPVDSSKVDASKDRTGGFTALDGLEQHVSLKDGRLPSAEPVNGVIEALVTSGALSKMSMVLDNEFVSVDETGNGTFKIKPVGVIDVKDSNDLYFYSILSGYDDTFLINYNLFEKEFTDGKKLAVRSSYWYFALDYTKMTLETITSFQNTHGRIDQYLASDEKLSGYSLKAPAMQTLQSYFEKEQRLRLMLWSLNVPVMIMLAFYLFMVSNLIVDRQKNEIAVLRSRGAGRLQIIASYLIEGVVLGAIAFVIGPVAGMYLTKILGASNGFLEFVQRSSMDVKLNAEAYKYALATVSGSIVMTLIPVLLATKVTIVGRKQQLSRGSRLTFWHKFGVDIILLGISLYGLQSFRSRMNDLFANGLDSMSFKVDPLLFLIPALFILGLGLLMLRVYPWFIRLLYWCGKRFWPPSLYSTLIQVGRSSSQYQFIMVFLIITMATGLFSASAARTMNRNADDQIRYKSGADITMQVQWENDAPPPELSSEGDGEEESSDTPAAVATGPKKIQYSEPPFQPFVQLPGVQNAAKVFDKRDAILTSGKNQTTIELMGIDTDEFGRVAWMRDRLLDHHFNDYLNLMAGDPAAVLISKSVADEVGAKPGDTLTVGWKGLNSAQFKVYGIVDYWPSWNPSPELSTKSDASSKTKGKSVVYPKLIVGHLSYIQNNLALEPYSIWLKLEPGAKTQELYDAIQDQNLPVTQVSNSSQLLIKQKNDPFQLAINGVMTLGFLISILISFFGFLLYWILSLSGRILQFGILRAMGISFMQLVGMLISEQILTSGAAILLGSVTGLLTSRLFVPLFKLSFNPATQVPPFQVTFDPNDQLQLYLIAGVMMGIGLLILGYMLSRIKIHQAVKLGED